MTVNDDVWCGACEACVNATCPCGHCRPHHKPLASARPCELCPCPSHGTPAAVGGTCDAEQQLSLFGDAA